MKLLMLRHGKTKGNALGQYIGRTDEPLSPEGEAELKWLSQDTGVNQVFVSPLIRTLQTADILFPCARHIIIDNFREMNFGDFEGKTAPELESDPRYRIWVNSWSTEKCPNGEGYQDFADRVCQAFCHVLTQFTDEKQEKAVFILHGGTIMSILERYALPPKSFYDYWMENGSGWQCRVNSFSPVQLIQPERFSKEERLSDIKK